MSKGEPATSARTSATRRMMTQEDGMRDETNKVLHIATTDAKRVRHASCITSAHSIVRNRKSEVCRVFERPTGQPSARRHEEAGAFLSSLGTTGKKNKKTHRGVSAAR